MAAVPRYRQTFVRLLGFLKPYKVSLAISTVLAIGYQASQIAVVWVTKHVIDNAIAPHDPHKLGFYDRHQTGQLMSRATVDLQGVRFFLGYGLIFFFQNFLTVLFVTAVLFVFQWKLALIALAITPVLVALAYRYSHVSHPTLREVQQKLADVATVAEENIVGVHVVKAFAQEPN